MIRSNVFIVFAVLVVSLRLSAAPADAIAEQLVLAPQPGSTPEDVAIAQAQTKAQAANAKPGAWLELGWAFVAKARRTLDAGYFALAEKCVDVAEQHVGSSPDLRLLRGHVFHNLHRFHDAETIARALVRERGADTDLALLSDALIEQGKLDEGISVLQRLVAQRPGAEAYSRISYVRWLKGDLPGAITAAEWAERACAASDSVNSAWLMARLSLLHLQQGDSAKALVLADTASRRVPRYPPALLARGRALLALGRNDEALPALRQAADLNPLPEYQWWLADTLRAHGDTAEAAIVEREIVKRGAASDPRTLALFLATRGTDSARAVTLARAELENRQDVFSYDALAWALLAAGDANGADAAMARVLAGRTHDARLALHAAMIARRLGREDRVRARLAEATQAAATLTPGEREQLRALSSARLAATTPAPFPPREISNSLP